MSASKKYVANRDVVQTTLHALGLKEGEYMTGRVLHEVFQEPQVATTSNAGRYGNRFHQSLFMSVLFCVLNYL